MYDQAKGVKRIFLLASLAAALISIPLENNLNSIALILFVCSCAIQFPVGIAVQRLKQTRVWMFPTGIFLLMACSYFWDTSGGFSMKDLERYAALAFIPASLALMPALSRREFRLLCFGFIATICLICIIALALSSAEYQRTGDYRMFHYHYLGYQVGLNAIFLSSYCLTSTVLLLYLGFIAPKKNKTPAYIYALIILVCIFFFVMVLLLSSKLIIVLMILAVTGFAIYIGYIRNYFIPVIIAIGFIILGGLFALRNSEYLKWRVNVTEMKMYSGPEDDQNGLAIRMLMWATAIDLIKERPVLGYGIRGARQEAVQEYRKRGFRQGYEQNYHSHNQYLETTLMTGFPGLALLLGMLIAIARRAVAQRNVLLFVMLAHFTVQSLIGSTFEVQQDLVFYLFFVFLFYYHVPLPPRITHKNDT